MAFRTLRLLVQTKTIKMGFAPRNNATKRNFSREPIASHLAERKLLVFPFSALKHDHHNINQESTIQV